MLGERNTTLSRNRPSRSAMPTSRPRCGTCLMVIDGEAAPALLADPLGVEGRLGVTTGEIRDGRGRPDGPMWAAHLGRADAV